MIFLQQNVAPSPAAPVANQGPTPQQIQQITDNAVREALAGFKQAGAQTTRIDGVPGFPNGLVINRDGAYGGRNFAPPSQGAAVAIGFMVLCAITVIAWPIARALGRRIDRKTQPLPTNPAMAEQLQRIEQAVDAMSIEIERISESQRFMAKLQA